MTPPPQPLTEAELEELEAAEREAFRAPWTAREFEIECPHSGDDMHTCAEVEAREEYPHGPGDERADEGEGQCVVQIDVPGLETFAARNARFIALSRNRLAALVAEVRAARAPVMDTEIDRTVLVARGMLEGLAAHLHNHGRSSDRVLVDDAEIGVSLVAIRSLAALARRNARDAVAFRALQAELAPLVEAVRDKDVRSVSPPACSAAWFKSCADLADAYIAATARAGGG